MSEYQSTIPTDLSPRDQEMARKSSGRHLPWKSMSEDERVEAARKNKPSLIGAPDNGFDIPDLTPRAHSQVKTVKSTGDSGVMQPWPEPEEEKKGSREPGKAIMQPLVFDQDSRKQSHHVVKGHNRNTPSGEVTVKKHNRRNPGSGGGEEFDWAKDRLVPGGMVLFGCVMWLATSLGQPADAQKTKNQPPEDGVRVMSEMKANLVSVKRVAEELPAVFDTKQELVAPIPNKDVLSEESIKEISQDEKKVEPTKVLETPTPTIKPVENKQETIITTETSSKEAKVQENIPSYDPENPTFKYQDAVENAMRETGLTKYDFNLIRASENKLERLTVFNTNSDGTIDYGWGQRNIKPDDIEEMERLKDPYYSTLKVGEKLKNDMELLQDPVLAIAAYNRGVSGSLSNPTAAIKRAQWVYYLAGMDMPSTPFTQNPNEFLKEHWSEYQSKGLSIPNKPPAVSKDMATQLKKLTIKTDSHSQGTSSAK